MSNKHDANVQKSSLVNFQIGLIASLLFTYIMFEVYTTEPIVHKPPVIEDFDEETNYSMDTFIIEPELQKKVVAKIEQPKVPDLTKIEEVPDETILDQLKEEYQHVEPEASIPVSTGEIESIDKEEELVEVPFMVVENVPIFPGCEHLETNQEKAACFNQKIRKIVSRKFNTSLGSEYGLQGTQKIYTQFDVAQDGTIQNIKIRAPHPKLEKEANRVINLFPKMTPGMQRKVPVTVKYALPIVFQVQD